MEYNVTLLKEYLDNLRDNLFKNKDKVYLSSRWSIDTCKFAYYGLEYIRKKSLEFRKIKENTRFELYKIKNDQEVIKNINLLIINYSKDIDYLIEATRNIENREQYEAMHQTILILFDRLCSESILFLQK